MSRLHDKLAQKPVLLADGALGTNLFARGLLTGDSPELWNVERPGDLLQLHADFIAAGADIILTNSFGGNAHRLQLHNLQNRVPELNRAAAELARQAVERSGKDVLVAGSIGPTGEIFEPVGTLGSADGFAAFKAQSKALADGGADLLWVETMSSAEELTVAVEAANLTGLPVVATMSFDTHGRTMMGLTPDAALALSHSLAQPPAGFGANCGIGPAQLIATILGFSRLERANDIIVAKGNCGIPEFANGHIHYSGTIEIMIDYAKLAQDAGARIIGGCCGTTPAHLAGMAKALERRQRGPVPEFGEIEQRLGPISRVDPQTEPSRRTRRSTRQRGGRSKDANEPKDCWQALGGAGGGT